jgi:hypothetical protein
MQDSDSTVEVKVLATMLAMEQGDGWLARCEQLVDDYATPLAREAYTEAQGWLWLAELGARLTIDALREQREADHAELALLSPGERAWMRAGA